MIGQFAVFIVSLLVVVFFSNIVIRAVMKLAEYLKIAEFAIGFVVISVFTSLPEFIISTTAAYSGEPGIAIGNVLGSNITNILLVLGLAIVVRGVNVHRKELEENSEILLLITLAPLIFFLRGALGFFDGLLLVLLFVIYAFFVIKRDYHFEFPDHVLAKDWIVTNIQFWFGMVIVIISARFVISSAAAIATMLSMPESAIAVTLIAFGTSLPELAIAVGAVKRGHTSLALGEILGSNVVNLTLVLGTAAIIHPLSADYETFASTIAFLVAICLMLWYLLTKHTRLSRRHGMIFIILYVLFIMSEMLIQAV